MRALVVRIGARRLALDPAHAAGAARRPPLTRVPGAPPALAGLVALDGRAVPVLTLDGADPGPFVLKFAGEPAALAVDAIEGFAEAPDAEPLDLAALRAQALADASPRANAAPAAKPAPATGGEERALLEFALGGQRFALPLAQARAVIALPDLTPVPGADAIVRGLAPFGEGVLPVVELADLVGVAPSGPRARAIVVEIGGAPVGLAVEAPVAIRRLPRRAVSLAPAALNRGQGEARVAEVARTDAGLILILAPALLFDEATTRRLEALAVAAAPAPKPEAAEAEEAFVLFRLGDERYALPADGVEAVAPPPKAPPSSIAATLVHRGEVFALVDARARFGAPAGVPGAALILRAGGLSAGLLVDAVEGVARFPRSRLEPGPRAPFDRVAEGPLLIADPASLLGQALADLRRA
jgi:purine-binding chemotaxis protein CheW